MSNESQAEEKRKKDVLVIDTAAIMTGTCTIQPSGDQIFAICREGDTFKVFPVDKSLEKKLKKVI
jgi:hypothetical protein